MSTMLTSIDLSVLFSPYLGGHARIIDDRWNDVEPFEVGEIIVNSKSGDVGLLEKV